MDNKNLVIAVVLCLIILFGWGRFAEYMGWVKPSVPISEQTAPATRAPEPAKSASTAMAPPAEPVSGRDFVVATPLYEATFYSGGGFLRSFLLKKYREGILQDSPLVNMVDERAARFAPLGLIINGHPSWSNGSWTIDRDTDTLALDSGSDSLTVTGEMDGLTIARKFTFDAATYLIKEQIAITNHQDNGRDVRVSLTQALDSGKASGTQYDSMRIAWDANGKLDDVSSSKTLETSGVIETGKIWWAGPMSTYFLAAALPGRPDDVTVRGRVGDGVWRVSVETEGLYLKAGQTGILEASYWTGPKVRALLEQVSDQLAKSIDLGFFSIISKALLWLLEFFQKYVGNWGVAIIMLTFLIKAIFWPLTAKSFASMEKMKQVQPLMKKIQEKYKDNREEMNKQVMALYRSYKINPAGGCVPILIQLPVFFGLYQALLTSVALRHASFITYLPGTHIIWLADLAAKDPLYISPILMGLSMLVLQRMSPPPADPMQRKIMMFLPLIFTVLFINFPAGLVVYWLVNNLLQILQQWLASRKHNRSGHSRTA